MAEMRAAERPQAAKDNKQNNISFLEILEALPVANVGGSDGCIDFEGENKDKMIITAPYVSYTEKETANEKERMLLDLFRENIRKLELDINQKLGDGAVKVEIKSEKFGKGRPLAHVIRFHLNEKNPTVESAQLAFKTIWEEFGNYVKDFSQPIKS